MTKDEAQILLNSLLVPFSKHQKSINANSKLSLNEKDNLLQIVIDAESQGSNYNKKYDSKLKDIAGLMKSYVKSASSVKISNGKNKGKQANIVLSPSSMPFLIKQVLFYIAFACKVHKAEQYTQAGIISIIQDFGVPISHNFFSKMDTTPTQYIAMQSYKQPKLHINYKGQKRDELAVAINNLAYQAGKYAVFCDIFGGSGAASLAVDRRKDAKYVYNDIDLGLYNLFEVIADNKLYLSLIDELERLQADLKGERVWLNLNDDGIDFNEQNKEYINSKKHPKDKNFDIIEDSSKDFELRLDKINKCMSDFREYVLGLSDDFAFDYKKVHYTKEDLLKNIFIENIYYPDNGKKDSLTPFASFIKNFDIIEYFDSNHCISSILYQTEGSYDSVRRNTEINHSIWDQLRQFKQYRFYKYYSYFSNMLKNNVIPSQNKVRYAVAKIFYQSIMTNASTDISAILRMYEMYDDVSNPAEVPSVINKFLNAKFDVIFDNIHKIAKKTICENIDCITLINKYKHSNNEEEVTDKNKKTRIKHNYPLFYSDSPYIGTSGYANAFTSNDMKNLINALKNSEDKFIFSCRAIKDKSPSSKTNVKKINKNILSDVFEQLEKTFGKNNLWVLVVRNKKKSLVDLIKSNAVIEVFITNFEIHSFVDSNYPNIAFDIYTFNDFLNILKANINI